MKRFTDNTYSLAKGLHHINMAKMYFEDLKTGSSGEIKSIFVQYIQKCDWILANTKDRLKKENREALSAELLESITIEAINDKLIHLSTEQKDLIENILDAIIRGEEVRVFDSNKVDQK